MIARLMLASMAAAAAAPGFAAAASARAPDRPVAIEFPELRANGPAVDGEPASGGVWPDGCAVSEGCAPQAYPPQCPAELVGRAVAWPARPPAGGDVVVRGPLLVQSDPQTLPREQRCAPAEPLPIVLGQDRSPLILDGLACSGDESRRCCAAMARGQEVIARGQLVASGSRWILRNPQLCSPPVKNMVPVGR